MPIELEKIEFGIYRLHVYGIVEYADVIRVTETSTASRDDSGETHQVFILDRDIDTDVNLSFNEIRQLVSMHDIRRTHYLHIDTGTAIRVVVAGINRITPLNILMVPDMDTAIVQGRDILSRYTQPRRKKKDEKN